MPESPRGKWLLLTLLCFAGAMVYTFPFLRYSYYDTMKEALDVTHTQMGLMQAVNGVAATFGYIPGGWLADRYSPRKLLATSLIVTGLSGFYFSTFPSYVGGLFLYGFWGVSTLIIFWAPFIKATRNLGPDTEQGRLFGFLEGGRGVFGFLIGMFTLFVFKEMGEGPTGLMWVINISAVVTIAAGLTVWLMFEDPPPGMASEALFQNFSGALKTPQVWVIGLIIFCGYGLFASQSYITPYMTGVMGAVVTYGVLMGILRTYGVQAIGAPVSGIVADKIGGPSIVIGFAFAIAALCMLILLMVPPELKNLAIVSNVMIVLAFCVFCTTRQLLCDFFGVKNPNAHYGDSCRGCLFCGLFTRGVHVSDDWLLVRFLSGSARLSNHLWLYAGAVSGRYFSHATLAAYQPTEWVRGAPAGWVKYFPMRRSGATERRVLFRLSM